MKINNNKQMIVLIVLVLIFSLVVGISIGAYLYNAIH